MRIALTYFEALTNPQGKRVNTSWDALLPRLSMARTVARKHDAPGISFAAFVGDRRSLANVEQVYALGLDLDEAVDWPTLVTLFGSTASFLHTTWSSTEADPRARVFLPLSRPVTGDEYRRVYAAVVERVEAGGLVVDRAASDPSRFWFLPSTPPGQAYRYAVGFGAPVDVPSALAHVPAAPAPIAPPPTTRPPSDDERKVEERAARYIALADPAISGSGGSTATFNVCQFLVRGFALSDEAAFRVLQDWNARCEPPWSERDLRRKIREAATRGTMALGQLRDARRAS